MDPQRIIHGGFGGRPRRSALHAAGFAVVFLFGIAALAIIALLSGAVSFAVAFVLAVVPVPALVAAVLALDRLEPEPTRKLVLAFTWGAGVAVLLAGTINTLGLNVTTALLGPRAGKWVSVVVGAPIVEELLKAAVLFGLLWFGRREVDGPTDGIVYAGMVGIGFAMTENVLKYAQVAGEAGLAELVGTVVLRGLISPFAHPLFTSMTGMALGFVALRRSRSLRLVVPLVGLGVAMVLHGLWNAAATTSMLWLGLYYMVVLLPVLGCVVVVTLLDRGRVVRLIARHLPQYSRYGLVAPEDVSMLSKLLYRKHARFWARKHGRDAWRAVRDYQLAATELALLEDRVERGVADRRAAPRRRESLMRLMGAARDGYMWPYQGQQEPLRPPWSLPPPPGLRT